ncbi:hypothetical protein GEMRC1_004247 [Eukaryota sp. GEM-RC1]
MKVSEVRFKSNNYGGIIYKCNGAPGYNDGYTKVEMTRPISVYGDRYEYYQLNLNRYSYVEYSATLSKPIDFYLIRGNNYMQRFVNGDSFYSEQDYRYARQVSNTLTSTKTDAYFWVFENLYSVFSADGQVSWNAFLRTFDVSGCETICHLEQDPYCIVPINRGSDEKIILEGTHTGNTVSDITFEETKYPADWGQPLAIISVCLFAVSICICMLAACIGKNRSSSSETQNLIQPAPQPTVVVNNNNMYQQPSGMYQGEPQVYAPPM